MSEELKPCPFCGSDAELTNIVAGPRVQCPNCLACGPCAGTANAYTDDDYAACKDKAVEDWNSLSAVTAERDRLVEDEAEATAVVDQLAKLLAGVSVAVRGPELPLQRHSYHDLPERVTETIAERDQLRAEGEALRPIHAMILNALDRDAEEGKTARGEMAAELRAALAAKEA